MAYIQDLNVIDIIYSYLRFEEMKKLIYLFNYDEEFIINFFGYAINDGRLVGFKKALYHHLIIRTPIYNREYYKERILNMTNRDIYIQCSHWELIPREFTILLNNTQCCLHKFKNDNDNTVICQTISDNEYSLDSTIRKTYKFHIKILYYNRRDAIYESYIKWHIGSDINPIVYEKKIGKYISFSIHRYVDRKYINNTELYNCSFRFPMFIINYDYLEDLIFH